MPRKRKKEQIEKRNEMRKARLAKIAKKCSEKNSKNEITDIEPEELKKYSKIFAPEYSVDFNDLIVDGNVFGAEKTRLQKELESFQSPIVLYFQEFLENPKMEKERIEVLEKIKYLLKRRFSLITIADILETNDYGRLDKLIRKKDETFQAVEKYIGENGEEPLKLFSGFENVVSDDYSKIYSEQEKRMREIIESLYTGSYFEDAEQEEKVEVKIFVEDIIANVIDNPDFNLACQIEAEFIINQLTRASKILSELCSRKKLEDLIEELKSQINEFTIRGEAYRVMDRLVYGRKEDRNIIEEGER